MVATSHVWVGRLVCAREFLKQPCFFRGASLPLRSPLVENSRSNSCRRDPESLWVNKGLRRLVRSFVGPPVRLLRASACLACQRAERGAPTPCSGIRSWRRLGRARTAWSTRCVHQFKLVCVHFGNGCPRRGPPLVEIGVSCAALAVSHPAVSVLRRKDVLSTNTPFVVTIPCHRRLAVCARTRRGSTLALNPNPVCLSLDLAQRVSGAGGIGGWFREGR